MMCADAASEMTSDFHDGCLKINVDVPVGRLKHRAAGNGYQVESFQSPLPNRIRLQTPEDLSEPSFRAVACNSIPKLSGRDEAQPIAGEAVCHAQQGHISGGHAVPIFLNSQELRPGLESNRRSEPL